MSHGRNVLLQLILIYEMRICMERLFDQRKFTRLILRKMQHAGLSLREVQQQSGVDHAAVHRVVNGKAPNVENYLRLVRWLNARPLLTQSTVRKHPKPQR